MEQVKNLVPSAMPIYLKTPFKAIFLKENDSCLGDKTLEIFAITLNKNGVLKSVLVGAPGSTIGKILHRSELEYFIDNYYIVHRKRRTCYAYKKLMEYLEKRIITNALAEIRQVRKRTGG